MENINKNRKEEDTQVTYIPNSNGVQIFNHKEFGEVRVVGDSENPLFCLTDLCKVLLLEAKEVNRRLEDGVVSTHPIFDRLGRKQQALFVNEDGMYDVVLDSRKPIAKQFRKWITSEVLPSIRKHGGYVLTKEGDTEKDIEERIKNVYQSTLKRFELENLQLKEKTTFLENRIEKAKTVYFEQRNQITFLNNRIEKAENWYFEIKPRLDYVNQVIDVDNEDLNIGEVAKVLELPFGRNLLFKNLRERGIFFKDRNEPKQEFINKGFFKMRKVLVPNKTRYTLQPLVTQKGVQYINNIFNNGKN